MRYIIIPVVIILYIYWTYLSIKEINIERKTKNPTYGLSVTSWFCITVVIMSIFSINYW